MLEKSPFQGYNGSTMKNSPSLKEREEEVLKRWAKEGTFAATLKKTEGGKRFVFFEGPPTANGKPHIGHVLTRAYKDVIPRFKTMQGFFVERKAGWDTQGLPVELEVERAIGISGKQDIEKYGVAKFNEKCRESVWKYKEEWERLTKRIGFWLDMEDPYITYERSYIESLWAEVKAIYDKGLFVTGHKVLPYCPRCGTALSDHEVAQGYEEVTEPAVYVKFAVEGEENSFLLAWTTTPWTLPGNVALAVGEDIDYVKVQEGEEFFYLAKARTAILQGDYRVVEEMKGKALVGKRYTPLFRGLNLKEKTGKDAYYVAAADFVTVDEGTGVVHTAVMYGEDDYRLGERLDLPRYHTVDETGRFTEDVPEFAGTRVREIDPEIITALDRHGRLYRQEDYTHTYPFCWRCHTGLLYYAKDSWFIAMTKVKEQLLKNSRQIHWIPAHLKDGRFGEWLNNVVDWAISRDRYWGTPIPIWQCTTAECDEEVCIGSFKELDTRSRTRIKDDFDPHKPFVDHILLTCERCGGEMRRVPQVMDTWFDSGSMPFAQWHYPFENRERIEKGGNFPADFIAEAVDQTRGWFYTLLAVSTVLGHTVPPYKNVISLGHVNDKDGKKMSKHLGNVVDPWEVIARSSADAVRWYFYTVNDPGEGKNLDPEAIQTVLKKTFMILENVVKFYELYKDGEKREGNSHLLDQWLVARTQEVTGYVTKELERYNITRAARLLDTYIQDLSTWYVRRSRVRFKSGDPEALLTLEQALQTLAKLMAPFAPFFAEYLYEATRGEKKSVHLEDWPEAKTADAGVVRNMRTVRDIAVLGHAAREEARLKVRQPLSQAVIQGVKLDDAYRDIIAEELNVQEVVIGKIPAERGWITQEAGGISVGLDTILTDELKELGFVREFVRAVNAERKKLGLTPGDTVKLTYAAEGNAEKFFQTYGQYIRTGSSATAIERGEVEGTALELGDMAITFRIEKSP